MKTITVDQEVYEKLKDLARPFEEITPNDVIRRLLGLPQKKLCITEESDNIQTNKQDLTTITSMSKRDMSNIQSVDNLRKLSPFVHPAFLTFLFDKFKNTKGNYKTSDIIPFMKHFNLITPSGSFRNPWMNDPYHDKNSCIRTIEHFKQCRKYGCWGGRDLKQDCNIVSCIYHPNNPDKLKNKCDLRKGVIWKRQNPKSLVSYGNSYVKVIKEELLESKSIPVEPLLKVFYPNMSFDKSLIERFIQDFHLNDKEMVLLLI
ncbi:MAG: hypothetical protein A2Y97_07840 [Nitrospirae bacterium RBG_13_39_12]|nr:MAG: hypothetical protein A2Y97_07840 [Nitrospirae bacterium RBG_13_39_12]